MTERFYSEYGEDAWIAKHLTLPERGFYLDLGAAHPERWSNTAFLRDRGWLGLAVDGNADYAPHWIGRQQFIHSILSSQPYVRWANVPHDTMVSHIAKPDEPGGEWPANTLKQLLGWTLGFAQPKIEHIDFLSIDLEGHEFDVFQTFDWQSYDPTIIIAEYNTHGVEDFRLRELLLGSGRYAEVHRTVSSIIFNRK